MATFYYWSLEECGTIIRKLLTPRIKIVFRKHHDVHTQSVQISLYDQADLMCAYDCVRQHRERERECEWHGERERKQQRKRY